LQAGSRRFSCKPNERTIPALSPDGRWLTYSSDESGTHQVYVRAFPDQGRQVADFKSGIYPMWSRNGRCSSDAGSKIMAALYAMKTIPS
jgi:Tol biopolymer transport system component